MHDLPLCQLFFVLFTKPHLTLLFRVYEGFLSDICVPTEAKETVRHSPSGLLPMASPVVPLVGSRGERYVWFARELSAALR